MDEKNTRVVKFSDGEAYLWVEAESSLMLKAITKSGEPVELEAEEARELGETLIKMAAQIEK